MQPAPAYDAFERNLNTEFQVERSDAHPVVLELVAASVIPAPAGYDAFSIVFRGPSGTLLPQAIYYFQHSDLGAFELFIVPIRQDQYGLYYEAVFNQLRTVGQA